MIQVFVEHEDQLELKFYTVSASELLDSVAAIGAMAMPKCYTHSS